MEDSRKLLLKSIIRFLVPELTNPELDSDQRDSLEVAIQCLETTYCLEGHRDDLDTLDLLDLVQKASAANPEKEVTDEDKERAEILKEEGNQAMKAQHFFLASLKYSEYVYLGFDKSVCEAVLQALEVAPNPLTPLFYSRQPNTAINLNPRNAVYYCNRAAAYSRLEKHEEAIEDCKNALRLDPNYGKAYGRLGIAYCSLQNFEEAKKAYGRALELDPDNASYKANYDRADKHLAEQLNRNPRVVDFQRLINSPNLVNIASQMLNDPSFRNVVSDIMNADGRSSNDTINVLLQAGQQIAAQVESADPTFGEILRRRFNPDIAQAAADSEDQPFGPSGSHQNQDKTKPSDTDDE